MEKFSKWRDPATGIQPFLPPVPPSTVPQFIQALTSPFRLISCLPRAILLSFIALIHVVLVDGLCLIFIPLPPLYRAVSGLFTAITCRLSLLVMGYYWITTETVSPKRGPKGVSQITNRAPRKGDLIVSNWTSYIDVLYLAFRHNPTFVLPIFTPPPPTSRKTGRHTGTGSAVISQTLPQPALIGYKTYTLWEMLARTGSLPETFDSLPVKTYKTLREARRKEGKPVCVFPEGTTGNGRAVLRFAEGIFEDDIGDEGIVWVKFLRHPAPTTFLPTSTCPLPSPVNHLLNSTLWSPYPLPSRQLHIKTLNPNQAPSSPSFLPSEVVSSAGVGLEKSAGVWGEALGILLAETGRVRRVRGMGWVEKEGFLEFGEMKGKKRR